MCKKFGVFANVLLEDVQLKKPFDGKHLSEHLEMIFPGLGNRIDIKHKSPDRSQLNIAAALQRAMKTKSTGGLHEKPSSKTIMQQMHYSSYSNGSPPKRSRFDAEIHCYSSNGMAVSSPAASVVSVSSTVSSATTCKSTLNKCLDNFSGVFDSMFQLNASLEKKLNSIETVHQAEIKIHEEKFVKVMEQVSRLNDAHTKEMLLETKSYNKKILKLEEKHALQLTELEEQFETKLKNQLQLMKTEHAKEIEKLVAAKDQERERAVIDARNKYKQEHKHLVEDAKTKKFCIACGNGKPLDLFYVCNDNCMQLYRFVLFWMMFFMEFLKISMYFWFVNLFKASCVFLFVFLFYILLFHY